MILLDVFRVAVRWLHLLAGVAWVGGSAFYLLVMRPAVAVAAPSSEFMTTIDGRFRDLVQLSILVLLATGAIITFDRLQLEPGPAYVVTLGVKVALAVWMFVIAQDLARRGRRRLIEQRLGHSTGGRRGVPSWLVLALGMVILLLSDVLKVIGPPS